MRILLTGATGFLGRHVGRALIAGGHEVLGTTSSLKEQMAGETGLCVLRMGDRLPIEIQDFAPSAVVHLAWEGIPDFSAERCGFNRRTQEVFFHEVLELSSVRRVVAAGTCREYGDLKGRSPGSVQAYPVDEFGAAKDGLHRTLRESCLVHGVELIWFRIFYVYGPGQRKASLIPSVLHQIAAGQDPEAENPKGAHDFVHVDDVASAFLAAVESESPPAVVDVGFGRAYQVTEVLETALAVVGGGSLASGTRPTEEESLVADLSGGEALGWRPAINLAEGIRTMMESFGGLAP